MESLEGEREALLLLTLAKGWGPRLVRRAIEALGSPSRVLGASAATVAEVVEGVGAVRAEALLRAASHAAAGAQIAQTLDAVSQAQAQVVTLLDEEAYPPLLAPLPDAPPVLYVRGSLTALAQWRCVAVVGSRRMSHYGGEQAHRFATGFAQAGLRVVSGGARGVDAAAHEAALTAGGNTIVVQGAGLAHTYPPEHAQLFARVVEQGGCVLSELAPEVPPSRETFPRRNRIIAGMSLGTLVVEAPRTSGALITARCALEQGREVFAVPGRLD
ncbi:MAG: DNA-protecting protein DprA, partial [Planctomycetota bacterium]